MSYCPDCGTSAYCPGLACKSCRMEAWATLQREREYCRERGVLHPTEVPAVVKERPGFGEAPEGFRR